MLSGSIQEEHLARDKARPAGRRRHPIVTANDYGPETQFRFESFLTPTTLYADEGSDHPRALKLIPARFDASGLSTTQHEATSRDGTKIRISS